MNEEEDTKKHPFADQIPTDIPQAPEPASSPFAKPKKSGKNPFSASKRRIIILNVVLYSVVFAGLFGAAYWYLYKYSRSGILIIDPQESIEIRLNNKQVKTTKHEKGLFIQAQPGQYILSINKKSYSTFKQNIRLGRGKIAEIRPTFTLSPLFANQNDSISNSIDYVRASYDEKALYFLGNNRTTLYRMEIANLSQIPLTIAPLSGVVDVQWSQEPNVALIQQDSGIYLQELPSYDLVEQNLVKIGGTDIISPVFDPNNSRRLAFAYFPNSGERSLVFSDLTIKTIERKTELPDMVNPRIKWSKDSKYILIFDRSNDLSKNNLWVYNTSTGNFKQYTEEGNIMDAMFNPDGSQILTQKFNKTTEKMDLFLIDSRAGTLKNLNITGDINKIAWKDDRYFYSPNKDENELILFDTEKKTAKTIPFTFDSNLQINGMLYYPTNQNLIFYTSSAIYTINLSIE